MIEVSEEAVLFTARICGPSSAAAKAIANAKARRAAGEAVKFYKVQGAIIVQGQDSANNSAEGEKA
jgi:hypothetical protein